MNYFISTFFPAITVTSLLGLCVGCVTGHSVEADNPTGPVSPWSLEEVWTAQGPFHSPESVIYDADRKVFYVSNVNGYEENGIGYISALSPSGEIIEEKWLEGLNAPTGTAVQGDTLYAVDFSRLAEINIPTKTIRTFYEAPEGNKSGLNDITIAPNGDVFVSASWLSAIYKLEDGKLVEWIKDDELKWANGLYVDDEYLYVAAFYLRRINLQTKEVERIGDDSVLEDLEAIEPDGEGGYFITLIGEKPIMYLSPEGDIIEVLSRDTYSADIDYASSINMLVAPSGEDTVVGFSVRKHH